jgi:hypothetical protein
VHSPTHQVAPVRDAANAAAKSLFSVVNPFKAYELLPALFDGMQQVCHWPALMLHMCLCMCLHVAGSSVL